MRPYTVPDNVIDAIHAAAPTMEGRVNTTKEERADLKQSVEYAKDVHGSYYETPIENDVLERLLSDADELARLTAELMNLDRYYETWPNKAPFISKVDVEALLNNGDRNDQS